MNTHDSHDAMTRSLWSEIALSLALSMGASCEKEPAPEADPEPTQAPEAEASRWQRERDEQIRQGVEQGLEGFRLQRSPARP